MGSSTDRRRADPERRVVTVWAGSPTTSPPTCNGNLDAGGQTRASTVIIGVGDGTMRLAATSGAALIVGVVGYFGT